MSRFRKFFEELAQPEFRFYGACLALTHLLTAFLWHDNNIGVNVLNNLNPVCWPFFQGCHLIRDAISSNFSMLGLSYVALGSLAFALFFFKNSVIWANLFLALATLMKAFIFIQDYRLMGNYHYMQYLVILAYFFSYPGRSRFLILLLISFYFFAGLLKFNYDWLSGHAMIAPPAITGNLLLAGTFYVVVFELIIIWGLFSKNKVVQYFTFANIIVFHLFSWHIVGYFYPLTMFLLIYPLTWAPKLRIQEVKLYQWCLLALFATAQLLPKLMTQDSSVTGQYRMLALNMFDSKTTCENQFVITRNNRHQEIQYDPTLHGVRIWCDPIVYWNTARNLCRDLNRTEESEVSLFLSSKRNTDLDHKPLLNYKNFCTNPPVLTFWGEIK